jgi:hypothetical protein
MVSPLNITPSMAVEGGALAGNNGTIVSAEFRERKWVNTAGEPTISSYDNKQIVSTDMYIGIKVDGDEEVREQHYRVGNFNIIKPANPSEGGGHKRAEIGQFLVGVDSRTQQDTTEIQLRKDTDFMKFMTALIAAPGPNGIGIAEQEVQATFETGGIGALLVGLNCYWDRVTESRGSRESFYFIPTFINSKEAEAAPAPAASNVPPPPPVAGGTQAVADTDVEGQLSTFLAMYLDDATKYPNKTQPMFIAWLHEQHNEAAIEDLPKMMGYIGDNPSYVTDFGYVIQDDIISAANNG